MIKYNNNTINKMYHNGNLINDMQINNINAYQYVVDEVSHLPDSFVIPFVDSTVKQLCVSNWGGNVVSGEITYGEAKQVTSLGRVFYGNTNIFSFNELVYFTGLTSLSNGEFVSCRLLKDIVIPKSVTRLGNAVGSANVVPFRYCDSLSGLTILSDSTALSVEQMWSDGSYWMSSSHSSVPMVFPDRPMSMNYTFGYADYLGIVYFQSATPPTNLANADIARNTKLTTVYCPVGSYQAYYDILNPLGKTVIEYDFGTDPNNVLAKEKEWSTKVY